MCHHEHASSSVRRFECGKVDLSNYPLLHYWQFRGIFLQFFRSVAGEHSTFQQSPVCYSLFYLLFSVLFFFFLSFSIFLSMFLQLVSSLPLGSSLITGPALSSQKVLPTTRSLKLQRSSVWLSRKWGRTFIIGNVTGEVISVFAVSPIFHRGRYWISFRTFNRMHCRQTCNFRW